jgi:DivIVA domain-containing protein
MAVERFQAARADMPEISADLISGRRFAQTWRGYDPEEVKGFLAQVAEQVRTLRERLDIEVSARREADQRAMHPRIDEATLMSAVGEETAAILRSARTAGAEIIAKAEANADSLVKSAEAKSAELLAQSESLSTRRAEEAEVAANEVWAKALADAEEVRQSAHQDAEALNEEAAQKAQESIEAAEIVREKILTDLARRRKLATVQIEQLRAGRERLLDAYLVVRRTLDDVTDELQRADAEARAAAVAVGRLDRDEHTGELVDLHHEEPWDSVAAFGGAEPGGRTGEEKQTAETPVVLAPKITQVAATPPVATQAVAAPAVAVPGVATPPVTTPPAAGPPAAGPPAAGTPVAGAAVAAPSVAPPSVATVPPPSARAEGLPAQDNTAIVSRTDAIESVRIVRAEPGNGAKPSEDAPETAATGAKAGVATDQPPVAPAGEEESSLGAGDEAGQDKDVEGLFARLREDRDQATRAARKTLRDGSQKRGDAPAPQDAPATRDENGIADVDLPGAGATGEAAAVVVSDVTAGAELARASAPDAGVMLLQRGEEVTRDLGSSLARKLKRALQDEQNSMLDRLRSLKGTPTPANVLPDPDEHPDHFAEAGRPLLHQAAQAGAKVANDLCGDGGPPAGLEPQHIDDLADELGRTIAEPLRQRLELAMSSAGDDPSELATALGAAYREWKTQRIEPSAHHEVAAAFSRGAYVTFPDATLLRWVVGPSEGPCPDCEDNALAGDQTKGVAWPTGQLYPPAHPGCRCALVPAVPGTLTSSPPSGNSAPASDN